MAWKYSIYEQVQMQSSICYFKISLYNKNKMFA